MNIIGYDENGDPIWGDEDSVGPPIPTGEVDNTQYTTSQEQYDRAAAEGMGMSYEDYLAISGKGGTPYADLPQTDIGGNDRAPAEIDGNGNAVVVGTPSVTPGTTGTPTNAWSWDNIANRLKLKDADGNYDPRKILALAGGGLGLAGMLTDKPQTIQSMASLKAGMPALNAAQSFSPETLAMMQRPMKTGSALERVYAADMKSPIAPGQRYAEGGDVEMPGALTQAFEGAVQGAEGGQSDMIDAKLSPGEYVMDAESVSALGDGNTAAGIAKLDELRQQLRAQKRSAPADQIPPQAAGPLSYMQGAQ